MKFITKEEALEFLPEKNEAAKESEGLNRPQEKEIVLHPENVASLRYFCSQYVENINSGNIEASHHDAAAVVLYLLDILKIDWEGNSY